MSSELLPDPGNLKKNRKRFIIGETYRFNLVGSSPGSPGYGNVRGSNIYTDDSDLSTAAVHAGVLKPGVQGTVSVRILKGLSRYSASRRNGISSTAAASWPKSYEFAGVSVPIAPQNQGSTTLIQADPGSLNLNAALYQVGSIYRFNVLGTASGRTGAGPVWGYGIYTDDSDLSTAAVHAGVLASGARGTISVRVLPGQSTYQSANQNGVQSSGYGSWQRSFTFVTASGAPIEPVETETVQPSSEPQNQGAEQTQTTPGSRATLDPGKLNSNRNFYVEGQTYTFDVIGTASGSPESGTVWGAGVYTDDSDLSTAAVHAGALKAGERGMVTIRILPGRSNYASSTNYGINTLAYGSWFRSFEFVGVPTAQTEQVPQNSRSSSNPQTPNQPISSTISAQADPGTLHQNRNLYIEGTIYQFSLRGTTPGQQGSGSVWGSTTYTDDSDLSTAAVHAGVLAANTDGVVAVRILPGRNAYNGSTQNNVTSNSWGSYSRSFEFVQPVAASQPSTLLVDEHITKSPIVADVTTTL